MKPNRRTFLKVLGGGVATVAAHSFLAKALADNAAGSNEYFIFIHASGGWDVMLWSDPRNQEVGIINPPSSDNTDTTGLKNWKDVTPTDTKAFDFVQRGNLVLGPAVGDLAQDGIWQRLCVVNGIEMNTVSHPDGTVFAATGRHLAGGRASQPSIDTIVTNELGTEQLLPLVSVRFPSWYVGTDLNPRAVPIRVGDVGTVGKSLARSNAFVTQTDRDAVTMLLSEEAADLAQLSHIPDKMGAMHLQYESLLKMLGDDVKGLFDTKALTEAQLKYPVGDRFSFAMPFQKSNALNAAFAVEAMKKDLVRCVSFSLGGIDTHSANYEDHALTLQEIFDVVATLVKQLQAEAHPNIPGHKLIEHTHIYVFSDFCRTPQINITGGRDHYPNNSALLISPRIKGNTVFGKTDEKELLPVNLPSVFSDGDRPVTPPDVLATLLAGVGIDERKYLREGEVIKELLVP